MRWLFVFALLGGCSFDGGGVAATADDVIVPDANPNAPDASTDPDAEAPPDAMVAPPDAMPGPDTDGDGVLNAVDNCPDDPNPTQHDEDTDTVGDACDNCPAVANLTQANTTEPSLVTGDEVGDACDPHPSTAQVIAHFEAFDGVGLPAGWTADTGSWTVSSDALHQGLTTAGSFILYYDEPYKDVTVITQASFDVVVINSSAGSDVHSIGPLTRYEPVSRTGYICTLYDDSVTSIDTILRDALYDDGGTSTLDFVSVGADMMTGQVYNLTATAIATAETCRANAFSATALDATYSDGLIGLRANAVAATFPYVMVLTPTP